MFGSSVSSLRSSGIQGYTAIVQPPLVAVLTIGGSTTKLVPGASEFVPEIVESFPLTLSFDSRVITEQAASELLALVQSFVESPMKMAVMDAMNRLPNEPDYL